MRVKPGKNAYYAHISSHTRLSIHLFLFLLISFLEWKPARKEEDHHPLVIIFFFLFSYHMWRTRTAPAPKSFFFSTDKKIYPHSCAYPHTHLLLLLYFLDTWSLDSFFSSPLANKISLSSVVFCSKGISMFSSVPWIPTSAFKSYKYFILLLSRHSND